MHLVLKAVRTVASFSIYQYYFVLLHICVMWYLLIKYSWLVSQKLLELHLAVESGSVCVVVQGNSGCGKSTLLRNYAHTRGYKDGESLLVIHLGEQIDSKVYSVMGDVMLHFVHAFGCWICLLGPYLEAKTDQAPLVDTVTAGPIQMWLCLEQVLFFSTHGENGYKEGKVCWVRLSSNLLGPCRLWWLLCCMLWRSYLQPSKQLLQTPQTHSQLASCRLVPRPSAGTNW